MLSYKQVCSTSNLAFTSELDWHQL